MRILFLIRDLEAGGAERQLVTLANGMARNGHAVTVGVFCSGGKFEGLIDRSKVDLVDLGKPEGIPRPSFLLRLRRLIRRLRPDVVHAYARSANTWAALAMVGAPGALVWGVRNAVRHARELDSELADFAARLLRRRAGLVIANSSGARAALIERGYPEARVCAIPNGIDAGRFRRDPEARRTLRRSWGLRDDETLAGFVGTPREEKDPRNFFLGAREALNRAPGLRFACIGYPNEQAAGKLRGLASEAGLDPSAVLWAPSRGDLHEVYSALDVLCLSSRSEGFPNVVAEAMACETPCVVTDVGDAAAIVGGLGWVVPPGRPEALGAAIAEASCPGRFPGHELRRRITGSFSVERLVERTEERLLELLPGARYGGRAASGERAAMEAGR